MNNQLRLSNQFLIAMPLLNDPNFSRSVTYICQHDDDGAMGVIINHPLELTLGEVLGDMGLSTTQDDVRDDTVFLGGPVQCERGFVLHQPVGEWEATLNVSDEIGITASRSLLASIAEGKGPKNSIIILGYAGWSAGQLEQEMLANSWLSGPADSDIIFNLPVEQRWQAAATCAGVVVTLLSGDIGHA